MVPRRTGLSRRRGRLGRRLALQSEGLAKFIGDAGLTGRLRLPSRRGSLSALNFSLLAATPKIGEALLFLLLLFFLLGPFGDRPDGADRQEKEKPEQIEFPLGEDVSDYRSHFVS